MGKTLENLRVHSLARQGSPRDVGFGFFASVTGVFCYGGLVGGFFATVGVGGFLRQCWGGFLRQWKGFWLRQGGLFASVGVFCDGNRGLLHRHRSAAERSIKKANPCGRL